MDSVILVRAASSMLLPPLSLILIAVAGALLSLFGRKRTGAVLLTLSLALLTLLSMPIVAQSIMASLTSGIPFLKDPRASNAQAIVILGGSVRFNALEYGGKDEPGPYTLGRLGYGAWLHEQTGLPILVSGGSPERRPESEASVMARSLRDSFKVRARWTEGESDNTEQNAKFSAKILKQAGITRILLVSDAWHLPRAMPMFADQGLQPVAAPTNGMDADSLQGALAWIPQAGALSVSRLALREWTGMAWYWLRH